MSTSNNYFGDCPMCGQTDGYMNVGRDHWFVCDTHKTKWRAGSNLFSCWRDEPQELWVNNNILLLGYRDVTQEGRTHVDATS